MGTISSLFFKIIDDETIGASKSPGMILSGQREDKNQNTDSNYKFSRFCHFTLKMDKRLIILQLISYPKKIQK